MWMEPATLGSGSDKSWAAPARRGRNSGPPSIIQLNCGSMILGTPVCSWWLHPGELRYHRKKRKIDSQKWAHDNDNDILCYIFYSRPEMIEHGIIWCADVHSRKQGCRKSPELAAGSVWFWFSWSSVFSFNYIHLSLTYFSTLPCFLCM